MIKSEKNNDAEIFVFTVHTELLCRLPNIKFRFTFINLFYNELSYAVAQLVETLHYKQKGRGFDSRWGH
jgi:hypothetical protein